MQNYSQLKAFMLQYSIADVLYSQYVATGFQATYSSITISIPAQPGQVPVMSVFDWIVFHQNLGGFNWRLSWAKYRDGFGSISSNFWLGLERLHRLTNSQSYRLRVEMLVESNGLWYSAEYWKFKIASNSNKYRLNVAGYSGDAGNVLHDSTFDYRHNGMKFSTVDRDNDLYTTGNCANAMNGGWWHNWCYKICLMCNDPRHRSYTLPGLQLVHSRMMIKSII